MTLFEAKNQILMMDKNNGDNMSIDGSNLYYFEKFEDDFAIFDSLKFSINELALLRMHLPLECFYIRNLAGWVECDLSMPNQSYFLINPHGQKEFQITHCYNDEDGNFIGDDGNSNNIYFWRLDVRSYTSPTVWTQEEIGCFFTLEEGKNYIKGVYER